jgi:hypothetical protein
VPSIACNILLNGQSRGITTLVMNICICITMFGFLSSKRYGLDRVAVKHVVLSFRFAIFVTLRAIDFALNIREVYTINLHPANVVAAAFRALFFFLCILLDCSPHLPPSAQIFVSVRALTNAMLRMREFVCWTSLQVAWLILYGYITFLHLQAISSGRDLDCFHDLGATKICGVTQKLSIYTSILLLMMQALVSRMLVPGISNFVNASVRRLHAPACGSTS